MMTAPNTTKFNPEGKTVLTYGECLRPAMEITDEADAAQYKKAYVAHIQHHLDANPRSDDLTAEEIANTNLGYFSGYYDNDTRRRVERLFGCAHPVFERADDGVPTSEQALEAGKRLVRGNG